MREQLHILIPLDGSKLAERAVAYVPAFMAMGVAKVLLTGVVEEEGHHGPLQEEDIERERNLLATYLEQVAEELRLSTTLEVEAKAIRGRPAETILSEAEAFQPDIVLLSTHGASGATRWRAGSVADKVIRGASWPVLAIGPGAASGEEAPAGKIMPAFQTLLVPLDGSELAEQAIPVATRIAEASGATMHLVTVVSPGDLAAGTVWAGNSPALEERLAQDANAYLERVYNSQQWPCAAHAAVRFGAPVEALEEFVAANQIDLIVMSSHGRGGLLRSALGSTTDRLTGGSACPVLIVRGQE